MRGKCGGEVPHNIKSCLRPLLHFPGSGGVGKCERGKVQLLAGAIIVLGRGAMATADRRSPPRPPSPANIAF